MIKKEVNKSALMGQAYLSDKDASSRFEKMPANIYYNSIDASKAVANEIATMIKIKELMGEMCVLGFVTGTSPLPILHELVRLHKEEGLSFKNVVSFNLYEYYFGASENLNICWNFMHDNLFNHVDIKPENINLLSGTIVKEKIREHCLEYERKVEKYGGFDLIVLGVGQTGHIAFNEPGTSETSSTRLVSLDNFTIIDAQSTFQGIKNIPKKVLTMGVGTILKAKKIILVALGEDKAKIIQRVVEGKVSDTLTATYLQKHPKITAILDEGASAELTRIKTPWLVDACEWDERLMRKGVVWLCQKLGKPILKLTDKDYNDNGMTDLLIKKESAYKINIKVFNDLQQTITGWPGGKPNADDTYRPERAKPFPKKVIIFSPHPDDDVISMGGTFLRLVEQGHEVHVAYQVSGNIAVQDDEALRLTNFVRDFNTYFEIESEKTAALQNKVTKFLRNKKSGQVDAEEVRKIKGLIRRGEASAACRYIGIPLNQIHFLDLPFYETGKVKKQPMGQKDIDIIIELLKSQQPHQIFAAGDLSDPHGTHRVCLDAIFAALEALKNEPWMKDCYIWLYRGAWQEWDIDQVDMAVPISPEELMKKRKAIFKHQSQKDDVPFLGNDEREFWQRAEERNRQTADLYNRLGMAEYEAIEAFVRYIP
jgi:glucosamine-6-phosphate deaminase